mgnify:CR=1 FL=1
MSVLVLAEHDNRELKPSTLNTVMAAQALGNDVTIVVTGSDCAAVGEQASTIAGVSKVFVAEDPIYANGLAENLTLLLVSLANDYSHLLAPATTSGKNIMPRLAALLDVAQISDITAIEAPDIFERPIYAGNAIASVKSIDPIKVITVRTLIYSIPSRLDLYNHKSTVYQTYAKSF